MGGHLVSRVLADWTHVSDRAFRVLVRMALTALDKPSPEHPAGIYHGGRELLAMSLRHKGGSERTRNRSVAEAIAELTEAGAIDHLATGWSGQKAVYRLTLDRAHSIDSSESVDDQMGGPTAHPMDGSQAHPMDVPTGTKRMGPGHTPRNQEEPIEELQEERRVVVETASHPPRATAPTPTRCPDHHIPLKPRTDRTEACPMCRRGVPPAAPTLATVTSLASRRPA